MSLIVLGTYVARPPFIGPLTTELEFTLGFPPAVDSQGLRWLQHYRKPVSRPAASLQVLEGTSPQALGLHGPLLVPLSLGWLLSRPHRPLFCLCFQSLACQYPRSEPHLV